MPGGWVGGPVCAVGVMDCCPLMVSELPVVCSRIDSVVTVVRAEQPSSASCHRLHWGESS